MEKIRLDLKDRKILYQLDLDARQSFHKIAKEVGLSKQVVGYRIKNLVKRGIIKNFYTILNVTNLGFMTFKIYLKVQNLDPAKEEEFITYLINHPSVAWLVTCNGEWDYNIVIFAKDIIEYNKVYQQILERYRDHFEKKDFATVIEAYQFRRAYILNQKEDTSKFDVMNSPERPEFKGDKKDWEILKLIAPNGRMGVQEIAKKLNISLKVVSYRIKNLIKREVIQSFRASFDVNLLGYQYYKVFMNLKNINKVKEKELFTWLRYHPNIVYVTKSIAKADYEFEMQAKDRNEFHIILRELRERFKEIIKNTESLHYQKEHKFLYMPEATHVTFK